MLYFTFAHFSRLPDSSDEAQILGLVQTLRDSLIHKQARMLAEALAEHFVLVLPAGPCLQTKQEVIAYHEQLFPLLPPLHSLDVKVKDITFVRPDVAIARLLGTDVFEMNGHKIQSEEIGGMTAVVEKGFWKIAHLGVLRIQLF